MADALTAMFASPVGSEARHMRHIAKYDHGATGGMSGLWDRNSAQR